MVKYSTTELKIIIKRTQEISKILDKHGIPITQETLNAYILGSNDGMEEAIKIFGGEQ